MNSTPPLSVTHPKLAAEWHPTRNAITPEEVTKGSHTKVWWLTHGHEWVSSVKDRTRPTRPTSCAVCKGRQVMSGVNDLQTVSPEIASEWSADNATTPSEIVWGSTARVKWDGACGHSWDSSPSFRVNSDGSVRSGCPYCDSKKVLAGFNDLATTRPDVLEMWSKSNTLRPDEVTRGSNIKVYWDCINGHTWKASVKSVVGLNSGCPSCFTPHNPNIETIIMSALQNHSPKQHVALGLMPSGRSIVVDVFAEPINLVVEYDGRRYHLDKVNTDSVKTKILLEKGYRVIRIRECGLPRLDITHRDYTEISATYNASKYGMNDLLAQYI